MKKSFPHALFRVVAVLLCLVASSSHARAQDTDRLSACASHTPPFVMFALGDPLTGFSFELLGQLASHMGRRLRVSKLPWARCLQEVKSGAIDLAIDAYDDAERRKTYFYSAPYHTLTPQLFFKANSLIETLHISKVDELSRFKGCGVHGYTYEHYDLDASTLDRGAGDDAKMLQKLKARHCDYAVEELEYIIGGRNYLANWPDESDLKSVRPAWARGPKLHFLIGKGHAEGRTLLSDLDHAIGLAEKSGQSAALRKKYFDNAAKPAKKP
jgi:polar amino acid transport system substrate-binding protein